MNSDVPHNPEAGPMFPGRLSWYDLRSDEVRDIAQLEYEARHSALDMVKSRISELEDSHGGLAAIPGTVDEMMTDANSIMSTYEATARERFERLANQRDLEPLGKGIETHPQTFGQWIELKKDVLRVNTKDLSKETGGVTRNYISAVANGKTKPSARWLRKFVNVIADIEGVSDDEESRLAYMKGISRLKVHSLDSKRRPRQTTVGELLGVVDEVI